MFIGASLVAQLVKNPAGKSSACNMEDPAWFLGWVDTVEKG